MLRKSTLECHSIVWKEPNDVLEPFLSVHLSSIIVDVLHLIG